MAEIMGRIMSLEERGVINVLYWEEGESARSACTANVDISNLPLIYRTPHLPSPFEFPTIFITNI